MTEADRFGIIYRGGDRVTKLLLRLFVKDHDNTDSPAVRGMIGKLAGTTGVICNCLLFVLKLTAGLLSGAVSVVADALNNLTDAASSVVTLLGFRLAQRPADPDHPYGHARYEYLSGLTVAALILVIGVELADSSVRKIINPTAVDISAVTFAVLGCSVAIKLWMSAFFASLGKKISSSALKAAAVDSRNDVIATAVVLIGCIISRFFDFPADGYMGLGVALFILYSGVGVAKETISPLLGQRADQELIERISKLVLSYEKVLGVHDLLVHDYGPGQCFASVHVELSAREDPLVCHDVIDAIECDALEMLNVHLVIHYDPVLENDREWEQLRQIVESIITEIDPELSLHDFRIARGADKPKLVFDLAVPYAMRQERKLLKEQIDEALTCQGVQYTTVIRFDDKV